jgi:hypothetical protein
MIEILDPPRDMPSDSSLLADTYFWAILKDTLVLDKLVGRHRA